MDGLLWRSGRKLWAFGFSRPFVLNDVLLRKIKQPLKKFRLTTMASQSVERFCVCRKTKIQIFITSCQSFRIIQTRVWIGDAFSYSTLAFHHQCRYDQDLVWKLCCTIHHCYLRAQWLGLVWVSFLVLGQSLLSQWSKIKNSIRKLLDEIKIFLDYIIMVCRCQQYICFIFWKIIFWF